MKGIGNGWSYWWPETKSWPGEDLLSLLAVAMIGILMTSLKFITEFGEAGYGNRTYSMTSAMSLGS